MISELNRATDKAAGNEVITFGTAAQFNPFSVSHRLSSILVLLRENSNFEQTKFGFIRVN